MVVKTGALLKETSYKVVAVIFGKRKYSAFLTTNVIKDALEPGVSVLAVGVAVIRKCSYHCMRS